MENKQKIFEGVHTLQSQLDDQRNVTRVVRPFRGDGERKHCRSGGYEEDLRMMGQKIEGLAQDRRPSL